MARERSIAGRQAIFEGSDIMAIPEAVARDYRAALARDRLRPAERDELARPGLYASATSSIRGADPCAGD
jgi:hypothetical protein